MSGVGAPRVVHEVVRRGQPRLPGQHQLPPERVETVPKFAHLRGQIGKRQGLEHVR